eukprot:UN26047
MDFSPTHVFNELMNYTVIAVLIHVYRNGPALDIMNFTVGFWEGASDAEICASIFH